ncbi:MAG TPA: ABC transporter ATP-binding protein [Candidatus Paceibacterota bacterium]|nr:ABC transporter ATP-binding protein [Candidatus Paceibacterota bacterium]
MESRRPIIECHDICKTYHNGDVSTPVLRNISFTISAGEFVAIMGPSGSGKSTLMHILGALDSPTSGTYKLDGRDVSTLTDDELADVRREKIGFVFQSFNLLPRATVLRNAILPLIYAETPPELREQLAEKALNAAGMPKDRWDHLSNQLSGGQMQRVAIARALINAPSIVLADEPTGNLDTKTGEVVLGTFQELNDREHHTIVLITHERYVAEHADRIIHIQDGVIVDDSRNSQRRIVNHRTA